jgi:PTS system mannose-specific IID component
MLPYRSDFGSAWLRSFAVQGSWNYRTLNGTGIGYTMLPLLRRIYAGDPVGLTEAVSRHIGPFNAHPYLSTMAVGALARLEAEGVPPEVIDRFKTALRGPLGTLGDRLVWAEWRPFCLLVAIVLFGAGLGPVMSVVVFLLLFNAGHLYLRTWAFRFGWESGLELGSALRASWLETAIGRLWPLNMLLLGACAVLLLGRILAFETGINWLPVAVIALVTGLVAFRWPKRGGQLGSALMLSIPLVWWAVEFVR